MLDVKAIARCLPHHFARAALWVLALCCLQAGVMRWGPQWMNLATIRKSVVYVDAFYLSADRRSALTQISIAHSGMQSLERALFIHRTEGSHVPQRLLPDRTDVRCAAMTHDGTRVAVATEDGLVRILTPDLRQATATLMDQVAPDLIDHMRWTNDGSKLVAVSSDFIYIWLYPECRRLHKLARSTIGTKSLELAPDSETLLLFHHGQYDVWNLTSGRPVETVELASHVHAVALSTDSRLAALAFKTGLCVWDLHQGREVWQRSVPAYSAFWQSIAISPDNSLVASVHPRGDAAPRIAVKRLSDGASVAAFESGVGHVTAIAFVSNTQVWICGFRGVMEGREIPSGRELWRHDFAALH